MSRDVVSKTLGLHFTCTTIIRELSLVFILALSLLSTGECAERPNLIVVFTDDQGWSDLGCQGVQQDISTPHIDNLSSRGVRLTNAYVTAPQCSPSRAGLMTGRYQQRFDLDHIGMCPLPLSEKLFAERLADAGYATGMVGKWHLEPNRISHAWAKREHPEIINPQSGRVVPPRHLVSPYLPNARGFTAVFQGERNTYWANYNLAGKLLQKPKQIACPGYRLEIQTDAAIQFVRQHHNQPFFLHLAYFAPHVPLESTPRYLARFPGDMPERRRYALAMMSAIDEGVGRLIAELRRLGIAEETLIVYTSDNGAPIKVEKKDLPIEFKGGAWDGSLNDPLNGEKGTLLEGGIRVPMVMAWPGTLPQGVTIDTPVSTLDIAPTALAMAGLQLSPELDGVNIIPHLRGEAPAPQRSLFWRFWSQAAIRRGNWKLLVLGSGEQYLFHLGNDLAEQHNLIDQHKAVADELLSQLRNWCSELTPTGIPCTPLNEEEQSWFSAYLGWEQ